MPKSIVSTPGVIGGVPRFDGTRISVRDTGLKMFRGQTYSQLLEDYPSLSQDDLYAAREWISFWDKWKATTYIRPLSARLKFLLIWFLDGCDVHVLRHRSHWVCTKLCNSPWWISW